MGINCSSEGGALLLAPGLPPAGTGVAGEAVGVEVAVAAGAEGGPGAVGNMLSEVPGEDAAVGVEGGTTGPGGTDVGEGEAVDGDTTGAGVSGLDGAAGEADTAVGLAAVDPAGLGVMPGVGEGVAIGSAVGEGKGSNSGDGVGVCSEVDAGVGAGVTGELFGCGEDGEKRGVEGDAYGEATCEPQLKLDENEAAAHVLRWLTVLRSCDVHIVCTVPTDLDACSLH